MEIELATLQRREVSLAGRVRVRDDAPRGTPGSLEDAGIRFATPVHVEGTARRAGGVYVVSGRLEGSLELTCSRCLCPVPREVAMDFQARYATADQAPATGEDDGGLAGDEGLALDREDLDVSFLPAGATHLDVAEVVREQLLLDVPIRPLCREDCRGLCACCGAELNGGGCSCDEGAAEELDPRLVALAELKRRLERS